MMKYLNELSNQLNSLTWANDFWTIILLIIVGIIGLSIFAAIGGYLVYGLIEYVYVTYFGDRKKKG